MLAARRLASRFQWIKNVKGIWFSGSAARRLASRFQWLKNEKGIWFSGSAARRLASRFQWIKNVKGIDLVARQVAGSPVAFSE